jgi:diguanylate cyclase (GGDEF)-like protein/PAS domain S-box-containing protein
MLAVNARMAALLGGAAPGFVGVKLGDFLVAGDAGVLRQQLLSGSGRFTVRLRNRGTALTCQVSHAEAAGQFHFMASRVTTEPAPAPEERLRVLNQIAHRLEFGKAEGFASALQTAAEYLEMDGAIISHIEGASYRVEHCWSRDGSLTPGAVYSFENTYCSITMQQEGVLAIGCMAESPHRGHPCYAAHQLETYLGIALEVEGKRQGTLNFFRRAARETPWGMADREFVALMGQWTVQSLTRLRTEMALASSELRFRTLVHAAPVGIYITDANGARLMVNERWQEMAGLSQEEALGEGWVTAVHPDDRGEVLQAWKTAAAANREFHKEYRLQQPDGVIVWVSASARPLCDDTGNVEGFIGTVTDITGRKTYEATLERQARVDEVTGLPNRRAFEHALHSEIARAMRYATPLSLLLIDLDHFKSVNDIHGHDTGDQVLRAAAYAIEASVRVADTPARYGGEEFALLLPQTRIKEAVAFSERLRQRIARLAHKTPAGDTLQVTCSIGVAEFDVAVPDERRLVKAADEALYAAKAAGRNRVLAARQSG